MNATDRKKANAIISQIEALKAQAEALAGELRELADAEQEKFDNMPEGLQGGDRGQAMEEAAGNLSSAADALESGSLEEALEALGQIEGLEV
ncbi:hypothetical protein ACP0H2_17870 [Pseudomonas aeruginosa]